MLMLQIENEINLKRKAENDGKNNLPSDHIRSFF